MNNAECDRVRFSSRHEVLERVIPKGSGFYRYQYKWRYPSERKPVSWSKVHSWQYKCKCFLDQMKAQFGAEALQVELASRKSAVWQMSKIISAGNDLYHLHVRPRVGHSLSIRLRPALPTLTTPASSAKAAPRTEHRPRSGTGVPWIASGGLAIPVAATTCFPPLRLCLCRTPRARLMEVSPSRPQMVSPRRIDRLTPGSRA